MPRTSRGRIITNKLDACRPRLCGAYNSWLWTQAGHEFPDLWVMIRPRHEGGGEQLSTRPSITGCRAIYMPEFLPGYFMPTDISVVPMPIIAVNLLILFKAARFS